MNKLTKIKSTIDWVLSWVLKLKLRKTYWSIAVPLGFIIVGEIGSKLEFITKATYRLYTDSSETYLKIIWGILHFWFSINLPWWSIVIIVLLLVLFTLIYLEELNAQKAGKELSEEDITNSIFNALSKKIDHELNEIKTKYTFQPNEDWFQKQCESSIHDLGKRYTPKLNVKLEIARIFEGLGRTEKFEDRFTDLFDQLLIKGKKVLKDKPEVKKFIEALERNFDELYALFNSTDFQGTQKLPTEELNKVVVNIEKNIDSIRDFYLTEERELQKEKENSRYYHKYSTELRQIREFDHELTVFKNFIHSTTFKLANNPCLVLDGDAGIGKSHLIGDVVTRRIDNNYESVFLLGQHFVTEEDPWTQIFKRLQIKSSSEKFLNKLNQRAEESGKRIVLFIDALNEGKGKYIWDNFVRSFINEIKQYSWLGLVLTVRSSYKDLIFPEDERTELKIIEYRHYGFKNVEYEASKLFFDNYNIELPKVPLLHPEFQNPLFLRLFCKGINKAGLSRIPDGLQGITSIIDFFVKNVNKILSKPNRIGYSSNLNLVKKSIYALIKYKVDNDLRYVTYESAYQIIDGEISNFINKKGFIDELILEGVLSKNLFWKENNDSEEGVYLAYERFEDHLTAQYLLEKFPDLEKEFQEGGKLYNYVNDEKSIYQNKGLIEAFSVHIPEINGREFYTYIPELKNEYPVVESFVDSLLWRKVETIDEKSKEYVNEYVFRYQGTYDHFWETILAVTAIPEHFFNAEALHNHLMKYSLADRDAHWTQFLKHKFSDESSVKRLIDWAWGQSDKSHINDESVILSSITLSWFHTSTNRKLRDSSTKALISLLQNRLDVLIDLLKLFEEVNDPYVYERLFGVAYGCAVRTDQEEKLGDLSEYIYKTIFKNKSSVIPHILLRDYARGVIEYSYHKNVSLSFNISEVRPPYSSTWPENTPSFEELEEKYDNDKYYHLWSSVMARGDFARYIIGTNSNYSEWSGVKKGEKPIDREQVFEDFKKKLNSTQLELLNNLDPIITEESDEEITIGDNTISFKTAVGRKSKEELNQIRDSFKKSLTDQLLKEYESEIEPFLDHNHNIINTSEHFDLRIAQRLILSRVIELGWNPELHLSFDKGIGTGRGRNTLPNERIGKKYQWIAYHEYMALLSDNFIKRDRYGDKEEKPYEGPWDPYVRDIDPTMLISKTGNYDDQEPEEFWWSNNETFDWDCSNEDWVKESNVLPNFENIISLKDPSGGEWLVLEGYPSWSEPKKIGEEKWDQPHKELWCQVRSYLVKDNEFTRFKNWSLEQDFMGRWMPESGDRYEMFSREYYWSPAHEYFMTEYYEGDEWVAVHDRESGEYIANVNVTAQGFLWEEEFDKSKEETISFLKPSTVIYEGMGLTYSHREGEFLDNSNEVLCFAANVYHDSKSYLLIKKSPFLNFLQENNLRIVWTLLGEKQIIGGRAFDSNYQNRLEISGAYYFDKERFTGDISTQIT